jgi:hypothetical protein
VSTEAVSEYPPKEHLELLHDQIARRAEQQGGELEGLDRKVSWILTSVGVMLSLTLTNAERFSVTTLDASKQFWFPVPFAIAVLSLACALLLGLATIWPQGVNVVPRPGRLIQGYYSKSKEETLAVLMSTGLRAFERNEGLVRTKSLRLRAQIIALSIGGVALVLAYLFRQLNW